MPLATLDQAVPFQWTMFPLLPTAQASLALLPQTLLRVFVVGGAAGALAQVVPFQ